MSSSLSSPLNANNSLAKLASVKDFEDTVCDRIAFYQFCEGKVFRFPPANRLFGLLLFHLPKTLHEVSLKPIEIDFMVQNCVELVVYRSEIGRRIAGSILSMCRAHKVLLGELFDECRSQIRFDLVPEESCLAFPSTCCDRRLDISVIDPEELGEGRI